MLVEACSITVTQFLGYDSTTVQNYSGGSSVDVRAAVQAVFNFTEEKNIPVTCT